MADAHEKGTGAERAEGAAAEFDDAELDRICLHNLLSACADKIYFKDRESHFLRASRSAAAFTGAGEPDTMIGKPVHAYFTPEQAAATVRTEQEIMRTGEAVNDIEESSMRAGDEVCLSTSKQPLRDFDGRIIGTFGISRDITARKDAEREVAARTAELDRVGHELKTLIDSSPDVMIRVDAQLRCTYVNPAAGRLSSLAEPHHLGRPVAEMGFAPEFTQVWDAALHEVLERREGVEREFSFPAAGQEVFLDARFVPELTEAGEVGSILAVCRDLTERRKLEQVLAEQAVRDPLTGLANRTLLVQRIRQALAVGGGRGIAVFFLDLDRFKAINDSLGHAVGDELLVEVADRLRESVRQGDLVARFGGDEFVILGRRIEAEADAAVLAERVRAHFAHPFTCGGTQVDVGASIGIALPEEGATTANALLRNADAAMYLAKESGEAGGYRFFESAAHEKAVDRVDLEHGLRHAAERGELTLDYQPIVDLAGDRILAAQALIRWRHPQRGVLAPAEFMPAAQESGLIVPIGRWLLDTACGQLGAWNAERAGGDRRLSMTLELSACQLAHDADLPAAVADAIARNDFAPEQLCLQVAESAALESSGATGAALAALSATGVRIALDGYGTGYSSLARLRDIPVDVLKIDPAFVDGLGRRHGDGVLVAAVIALAHALDLRVVADGVQTPEQRERLRELECDQGQGDLFSRPVAPDAFARLLGDGAS